MELEMEGMAMRPAPDYNNPPTYALEDSNRRSQLPYSHHNHNYEELPFPPQPTESSTDDVVLMEGKESFQRQGSHTEVDQYFNPPPLPVHSISSTPLTITEPAEKKPRKKVNPIYDRYEGPMEKITTSKEGYQRSGPKAPSSSKGQGRSFPVRCLRHPITTVFIFVLVAVVIIAVVLIMLGKIETPASNGSSDTQVRPKVTDPPATTPGSDGSVPDELLRMIQQQQSLILDLQARIGTLETMLGGGSEVNASLSTKVALNTIKIDGLESRVITLDGPTGTVALLQATQSNTINSLEATKGRTTSLENSTRQLDIQMRSLTALVAGQGMRITTNENTNTGQSTAISTAEQEISNLRQKFDLDLSQVNRTIYGELDTISKMQGPRGLNGTDGAPGQQGPPGQPGAGDLSMCDHQEFSTSTDTSVGATFSRLVTTPSDKIITGVACATTGGTLANLMVDTTGSAITYRCRCSGDDGSAQRVCYIHYWQCPKTS
ncbi:uncharacterized protein LOC119720243 isoform X2 [Patiria miniata]|uniref:Uncharacterized protein n=1 Tax=Patiria miniata TaxID=46514 RepID=A0A913Z1V3_PATMI|nr:uncharacterized protein LOC119720243 isoform X2 [Patiria miniata]